MTRLLSHAGDQVSRSERTAFKRRIAGASAKDRLRAMSKLTDGDIFLGWLRAEGIDGTPRDYYVRQLWDWKIGAEVELMSPARLTGLRPALRDHAALDDAARSGRVAAERGA